MNPDLLKTIRWAVLVLALTACALWCRPQVHVYLHHDITLQPLKK